MSQNDRLIEEMGLPVLTNKERVKLRSEWQAQTWDDMILSLNSFGKYIMLRPTGFGKTYTCACACNIGYRNEKKEKELGINLKQGEILLNNGTIINNTKLCDIQHKKVIFVYVSDILKQTFEAYDKTKDKHGVIKTDKNGESRIIYETYSKVAGHWGNENYLKEELDIENVGLVIFDEVQRMGAERTAEALDVAIPILEKLGIYYIGATATVERSTGFDVCDKYFVHNFNDKRKTFCWGEHIYTLGDAFRTGLILPPYYQYIDEDSDKKKKVRQTRLSVLQELEAKDANNPDNELDIKDMRELQRAVIKNSSKIIHDTMITLYNCDNSLITADEELTNAKFNEYERPDKLPKYMRFLVFTPDRASMTEIAKNEDTSKVFGGMVKQTISDFKKAFGRYGYNIRYTVISSYNKEEKEAVKLIDASHIKDENSVENGEAIVPTDMTIDLIFSINMLNVGYHVDHITGLIFKRWTGSNQIFYQQLGRCLSSVSDTIPVVFDYVKSIDSRGITAPLFTKDSDVKEITENADGTQNVFYKNKTRTADKPRSNNDFLMDDNGNPIDPRKCNTIDSKYIIVGMASATIEDIEARSNVYLDRETSRRLYDEAYKLYKSKVLVDDNNNLISNINKIGQLYQVLKLTIQNKYKANIKDISINFKAFIEYIKNKEYDTYIEYNVLDSYINSALNGFSYKSKGNEINSVLAVAKEKNNKGVNIKLLLNKKDIEKFKANIELRELLSRKLFDESKDIIIYEAS